MVRIAAAGLEAGAHAGLQRRLARIGDQRGGAFENVDELVLARMRVTKRRHRARRQARQINSENGKPERITERALRAISEARDKIFRIIALGLTRRGICRHKCHGIRWHDEALLSAKSQGARAPWPFAVPAKAPLFRIRALLR